MTERTSTRRSWMGALAALCIAGSGCGSSSSSAPDVDAGQPTDGAASGMEMDGMTMSEMDMAGMVSCKDDPRTATYQNGMAGVSQAGAVEVRILTADPAPPAKGMNTWTVQVQDSAGVPLAGPIAVTLDMPDHGHASPTTPVISAGASLGTFAVSQLNLFMPGVWRIQVSVYASGLDASPLLDVAAFYFCIEG